MGQGIYLDKWIVDLLATDEKAFRVAVYLVAHADQDGKTRATYQDIALGTGMTYKQARYVFEKAQGQSKNSAFGNHLAITRQSHTILFVINNEKIEKTDDLAITWQSLGNHEERERAITNKNDTPVCARSSNKPIEVISEHISNNKPTNSLVEETNPPIVLKDNAPLSKKTEGNTATVKRFVKPTIDEVKAYCEAKGSTVDPVAFWNFYESKGWVIGKSPMKNWHSAIATWERGNRSTYGNQAQATSAPARKSSVTAQSVAEYEKGMILETLRTSDDYRAIEREIRTKNIALAKSELAGKKDQEIERQLGELERKLAVVVSRLGIDYGKVRPILGL